jgi:hypothetical protein
MGARNGLVSFTEKGFFPYEKRVFFAENKIPVDAVTSYYLLHHVSLSLYIAISVCASLGIVECGAFLVFNMTFRKIRFENRNYFKHLWQLSFPIAISIQINQNVFPQHQ